MVEQNIVERKFLRPAEVAEQIGMSKSAVMAALWNGTLTAHRVGRAWLIDPAAVDDWIRGPRAQTNDEDVLTPVHTSASDLRPEFV